MVPSEVIVPIEVPSVEKIPVVVKSHHDQRYCRTDVVEFCHQKGLIVRHLHVLSIFL
jgi:hypothetical protein